MTFRGLSASHDPNPYLNRSWVARCNATKLPPSTLNFWAPAKRAPAPTPQDPVIRGFGKGVSRTVSPRFFSEKETEENGKKNRRKLEKSGKNRNLKKTEKKRKKWKRKKTEENRRKRENWKTETEKMEMEENRRKWKKRKKAEENGRKRKKMEKNEATPFRRPLLRNPEWSPKWSSMTGMRAELISVGEGGE